MARAQRLAQFALRMEPRFQHTEHLGLSSTPPHLRARPCFTSRRNHFDNSWRDALSSVDTTPTSTMTTDAATSLARMPLRSTVAIASTPVLAITAGHDLCGSHGHGAPHQRLGWSLPGRVPSPRRRCSPPPRATTSVARTGSTVPCHADRSTSTVLRQNLSLQQSRETPRPWTSAHGKAVAASTWYDRPTTAVLRQSSIAQQCREAPRPWTSTRSTTGEPGRPWLATAPRKDFILARQDAGNPSGLRNHLWRSPPSRTPGRAQFRQEPRAAGKLLEYPFCSSWPAQRLALSCVAPKERSD